MIDKALITIKAGNGGRGVASFLREKYNPKGGPDGGDGGNGGDVYIVATDQLSTLLDFRYQKHLEAENGKPGAGKNMKGRNGQDLILHVPTGSLVYVNRIEYEEIIENSSKILHERLKEYRQKVINYRRIVKEEKYKNSVSNIENQIEEGIMREKSEGEDDPITEDPHVPFHDLHYHEQKVLIAKGGKGGRGNNHFKSSTHQVPRECERGQRGELLEIQIVLKMIANVGIIGLPNAGKSSLLASLTAATPKIGSYPFTTIDPNLGVLKGGEKTIVLADLPGLIQGAHQGKGLGLRFLQHIERTKLLLHVVSPSDSYVELGPQGLAARLVQDYLDIRSELLLYRNGIEQKKEITIINKIDLIPTAHRSEYIKAIDEAFHGHSAQPIYISILEHAGLEGLRKILFQLFEQPLKSDD